MCDVAYERFLGLARELSHAPLALTAYDACHNDVHVNVARTLRDQTHATVHLDTGRDVH